MDMRLSLAWALDHISQIQGAKLDSLRMETALNGMTTSPTNFAELSKFCNKLGLKKFKLQQTIDRVHLPLLCFNHEHGWGVIVDRQPNNEWMVSFQESKRTFFEAELSTITRFEISSSRERGTFDQVLKRELRRYKTSLFEAAVATILIGVTTLGISLFSMQVYDRVIPTHGQSTLITLSLGVLLVILLELSLKIARSHIMDSVVMQLDSNLSRDIFQRLLNIRVDQLPTSVGSLAGQIRGYEQIRSFYTASTLFAAVDIPLCFIFIVIIGFIGNPYVSAVPLVFALLALIFGFSIRLKLRKLAESNQMASNFKTGLLVEAVEGSETIKAGSGGWKFLSRWIKFNAQSIQGDLQMRNTNEKTSYYVTAMQQISYASLIAVGAYGVIDGNMTMGSLIACSILSGRIMSPIMAIPNLLTQQAHADAAKKSLEKLYELEDDNFGIANPLSPQMLVGDFDFRDVKFSYPDAPPAIVIPSLHINAGERVAILGSIGAGKSTLLKLMAGLYQPQSGHILMNGLDIAHINRQVISQHVGYLQQEHRLFHGTLRENLLIGLPDPGDELIKQALLRSGLMSMVSSHSKGLELTIFEGGKGLSGGQRQLVAFTRLLLCNPSVLLLDEPTANMDRQQEIQCMSILSQEAEAGKTLIIVTHKPALLTLVNRIVVISKHQIVMDGARDEVLAMMTGQSLVQQN